MVRCSGTGTGTPLSRRRSALTSGSQFTTREDDSSSWTSVWRTLEFTQQCESSHSSQTTWCLSDKNQNKTSIFNLVTFKAPPPPSHAFCFLGRTRLMAATNTAWISPSWPHGTTSHCCMVKWKTLTPTKRSSVQILCSTSVGTWTGRWAGWRCGSSVASLNGSDTDAY